MMRVKGAPIERVTLYALRRCTILHPMLVRARSPAVCSSLNKYKYNIKKFNDQIHPKFSKFRVKGNHYVFVFINACAPRNGS